MIITGIFDTVNISEKNIQIESVLLDSIILDSKNTSHVGFVTIFNYA